MKNLEKKNPLLFSPLVVFPLGNESLARTQGSLHTPISIDSRSKAIPIRIFFSLKTSISSPDSSVGKESACNAGNPSSIPGLGRSLGEGNGYPLQYSGLENPMDCIVHGVTKSQTRLSDFHFQNSS